MAIRSWIGNLSRESPSEFRRYRQLSSALFLILAIGGAGLLGVSIAWELWGNGSKAQGTREVTGAEQTALQCADELGLLEQRLAQSLGALAGKATPETARSAWADFHRDWDRDLAGVVDRCQGTSVPGHEAFARATADLTATRNLAEAYRDHPEAWRNAFLVLSETGPAELAEVLRLWGFPRVLMGGGDPQAILRTPMRRAERAALVSNDASAWLGR